MGLKKLDLTKYYNVEKKVDSAGFLDIMDDMNRTTRGLGYHSYCVTDTLQDIYGADDCEIAFVTREYADKINHGPNCSLNDYKLFGLTIEGEDLLLACEDMREHGRTPLDVVANFALLAGETTELEIVKEASILYETRRNKLIEGNKQKIFRQYSPRKFY